MTKFSHISTGDLVRVYIHGQTTTEGRRFFRSGKVRSISYAGNPMCGKKFSSGYIILEGKFRRYWDAIGKWFVSDRIKIPLDKVTVIHKCTARESNVLHDTNSTPHYTGHSL